MSQLEEIKARADELGRISTRDLVNNLLEYGTEYTLLAEVEADHRRLLAALEAVLHLHQESDGDYRDIHDQQWCGKHCEACRDEWPCDTAETITEALQ